MYLLVEFPCQDWSGQTGQGHKSGDPGPTTSIKGTGTKQKTIKPTTGVAFPSVSYRYLRRMHDFLSHRAASLIAHFIALHSRPSEVKRPRNTVTTR